MKIKKEIDDCSIWISDRIDNQWSEPVNLGISNNSSENESGAQSSSDDKFLFFIRITEVGTFPYWVEADIFENLKFNNKKK